MSWPGIWASESRGIESFLTLPTPARMTRIESARPGPAWVWSIESPARLSEPSTSTLLPVARLLAPPVSASSAVLDTPVWVWALTMKITNDRSSQPPTASATHFATRLPVIGSRSEGCPGRLSRPGRLR